MEKHGNTFLHHFGGKLFGNDSLRSGLVCNSVRSKQGMEEQMDVLSWRILRKQFSRRPTGIDIFGGGGRTAESSTSTSRGQQERRPIERNNTNGKQIFL